MHVSASSEQELPSAIVVMGPSGGGKTTLAKALARSLSWSFVEGDDHHPPENLAKMAAGEPLTDEDRLPFLDRVGREMAINAPAVASCSSLARSHREILRQRAGEILFVLPELKGEELAQRVQARHDHFMPSSLLQSQISALEPPSADERHVRIDGSLPTPDQVELVLRHLRSPGAPRPPA